MTIVDKYPRTPHLPGSPGCTKDDRKLTSCVCLLNTDVVILEKLDGSNLSMTSTKVFARSHIGEPTHKSFDMAKQLHREIMQEIPDNVSVFGEWCYAVHSIEYNALPGYFMVFGIRNENNQMWLNWKETVKLAETLKLPMVPVVYDTSLTGCPKFETEKQLLAQIKLEMAVNPAGACEAAPEKEGLVIRNQGAFSAAYFGSNIAKWVRKDFIAGNLRWDEKPLTKNLLKFNKFSL